MSQYILELLSIPLIRARRRQEVAPKDPREVAAVVEADRSSRLPAAETLSEQMLSAAQTNRREILVRRHADVALKDALEMPGAEPGEVSEMREGRFISEGAFQVILDGGDSAVLRADANVRRSGVGEVAGAGHQKVEQRLLAL